MWQWKPYKISNSRYERSLERLFSKLFSERESVRALDYGCGHGHRAERIVQYLKPTVGPFLFDVDDDLLQRAIQRTGGQRWIPGKGRFDLILCFGVLELLPRPARAKVLELFADCMNGDSVLAIQHPNWRPLAARTIYWWFRSLSRRNTFASAARTHAEMRFKRDYGGLSALLGDIRQAGLTVTDRILGPYVRSVYLPLPASVR